MNRTAFLSHAACGAAFAFAALWPEFSAAQDATPPSAPRAPTAVAQVSAADAVPSPSMYFTMPKEFRHHKLASGSTDPVGTRLVCLFDVSGSIDSEEYAVQLEAMAAAIGSDDFRDAIFFKGGPESVAICVVDFGTNADLRIPWVDIRKGDEAKLKLLAREIRGLERRESGMTNHGTALELAEVCLKKCPWDARRSIVDMITDGKHNTGPQPKPYMESLAAAGATVNALITTTSSEPDLEDWSRENLLTPSGHKKPGGGEVEPGFVKVVATQESTKSPGATVEYHKAMELAFRRKLILEVASIELDDLRRAVAMSATNATGQGHAPAVSVPAFP